MYIVTDAPWCEIRPTHASSKFVTTQFPPAKKKEKWESGCSVKSRNEPRNLLLVQLWFNYWFFDFLHTCTGMFWRWLLV